MAMDEHIYDALVDLKQSIDKQMALQEQSNDVMRAMIGALEENAQAMADLGKILEKAKG
jgi:hypothetical protein